MTSELLNKIYSRMGDIETKYEINKNYVKGKNPEITREPTKTKPDNRLPIPFAKMAVDDMCGYAGRAQDIIITFDSVDVEKDDDPNEQLYQETVRGWMDYNSDGIETAELYRETLGQGKAYEIWWTSANDEPGLPIKPEYKMVDGNKVFIKYTDSIKPVKEYAVYFNKEEDFETDKERITALVMYPYQNILYEKFDSGWEVVPTVEYIDDIEISKPVQETPFSVVPCIETKANKDKEPIFEAEKKIIDQIDKICSKSLNEVDRFNALILLLPALASPEFAQKLSDLKVMDDLDKFTKNPEYLAKDLAGVTEFYKWLEELLEKMFRKSIKIPDMTDQSFSGNAEAAKALLIKLSQMEWRAADIENHFIPCLYERKQLFDDVINAGTLNIDTEAMTINITTKRNLPIDESERLDVAIKMKELMISNETILESLPSSIIKDVAKELERMNAEGEKRVNLLTNEDDADNTDNKDIPA